MAPKGVADRALESSLTTSKSGKGYVAGIATVIAGLLVGTAASAQDNCVSEAELKAFVVGNTLDERSGSFSNYYDKDGGIAGKWGASGYSGNYRIQENRLVNEFRSSQFNWSGCAVISGSKAEFLSDSGKVVYSFTRREGKAF